MSTPNSQQNEPQPIPFSDNPIIEQQPHIQPSMDRFPSTSEFNQPLQHNYSMASINYNDEQNPQLPIQQIGPSGHSFNEASMKDIQNKQEQPEEELQKVSLGKNDIDQDDILKMFREEEEKKKGRKDDYVVGDRKKASTATGGNASRGDKKHAANQQSSRKQQQQQNSTNNRRRQTLDDSLAFLHKTTSFKDTSKSGQQSPYAIIANSQSIRDLVLQYKIQYRSSIYDTDWQKQRYKLREQFFEQLCIGVEEMAQRPQSELSTAEHDVLENVRQISSTMSKLPYSFGVFKYCRNLVMQIDIELFVHFHQRSKQPLSKDYKGQYKFLITNLKDAQNYELRKKLLTHEWNADVIKVAIENQFFTQAKRTEIREKQQKLLKEFSVDRQRIMMKPEYEQEKEQQHISQNIKYDSSAMNERKGSQMPGQVQNVNSQQQSQLQSQQPLSISSLLSINKYLDESSLTQLEELLSDDQIEKMRRRLQEDLRGDCKERLMKKFDEQVIVRAE